MSWKNTRLSNSTKRLYDTAFGKYDFIVPLNEEQVVVLKIAECTKMKIQQNGHDFTVGQRRLTTSTLGSAIVFK